MERSLSASSHQGDMQIKTTIKHHYMYSGMVKIRRLTKQNLGKGIQ